MRRKKYLDLYYEFMEHGIMHGLCSEFRTYLGSSDDKSWNDLEPHQDELFALFYPTVKEFEKLDDYWLGPSGKFNDVRQNVVLFMACLNGEL